MYKLHVDVLHQKKASSAQLLQDLDDGQCPRQTFLETKRVDILLYNFNLLHLAKILIYLQGSSHQIQVPTIIQTTTPGEILPQDDVFT